MKKQNKRGFTLLELLVVVLIIGILAAIALPQYQKAVKKALYAKMLPILQDVVRAEQLYYLEHGTYATQFADLELNLPPTTKVCSAWGATDTHYVEGVCVGLSYMAGTSIRVIRPADGPTVNGYQYLLKKYNGKMPAGLYCVESRDETTRDLHCPGTFAHRDAWGYFFKTDKI